MKTNRRKFIQTLGTGVVGLGFSGSFPASATEVNQENQSIDTGSRKMIIAADDVGYTNVCNIGAFQAIENGFVTAADVMLDCPGSVDALERLKKFPWISVGWHFHHMWGSPVADTNQVQSLIEKEGEFKGRFRLDLNQAEDVVYNEAVIEIRAQIERCKKILGRIPDTRTGGNSNSPWGKASKQVSDENKLVYGVLSSSVGTTDQWIKRIEDGRKAGEEWAEYWSATPSPGTKADDKWADRNIVTMHGYDGYLPLLTDSFSALEKEYDPVLFYTEDRGGILKYPKNVIIKHAWHPGYVDYFVYRLGERQNRARARQFVLNRVQDVSALCDVRLRNWIKENNIELVNWRDALYGSREYQNHLKNINSDLAI